VKGHRVTTQQKTDPDPAPIKLVASSFDDPEALEVFDTNVLVSGLLFPGGPPSQLVRAWRAAAFELVISNFVIDELTRTWRTWRTWRPG
jgi:PIN domain